MRQAIEIHTFKHVMRILIAVDQSEYSEIVLEHGFDQAVRSNAGEVHVVTAVEGNDAVVSARTWLERMIDDLVDAFRCQDKSITLHVRRGRPAAAVATLATELQPDLLVIGHFHDPSGADVIRQLVEIPTLVVGVEGHLLEPQCRDCERVRHDSDGETLFCEAHAGDYVPDLVTRLPPSWNVASLIW